MKFKDFPYERPNLDEVKAQVDAILDNIGTGKSLDEEIAAIEEYWVIFDHVDTMDTLVSIRNSINTVDEFYEAEKLFFNQEMPKLQAYSKRFDEKLLSSPNRAGLEAKFGSLMFEQAELGLKVFDESIIPELQQENALDTEYDKLLASAKIEFQGGVYNLSQMSPFAQSKDRDVRKAAAAAVSGFFASHEATLDRIYDDLVKLRTTIATKLGYENFIQLGYDRMGRTDYGAKEVKTYRDQILQDIVPLVSELTARKAKRLGIEEPFHYDLALSFLNGNATPKGDVAWQVDKAKTMYQEMSPETNEWFSMMLDKELMDLDSKQGKEGGGYCTSLSDYKVPFIFANFNGTSHDVDVLTHEAGHALQKYLSKDHIPPYRWPTKESAEIHSMSMEFLAWPWMEQFFQEDTAKYKFNHLASSISFLPYGVLVDEFQHEVYGNPTLSPDERKSLWRRLEKKYLPFKDYGDDEFLERGGFWFRQGHIYWGPFYYIDYTLAQVCAFQYWVKHQADPKAAMQSYLELCRLGGSKSFTGLLASADLKNPFEQGTVAKIVTPIRAYLDSVDDLAL
jgi:oligoendopeptidase, M3 family